ncbi:LamG-like jellyroll fold domain-containing protein [Clavibacter zhangzhiyongii]|uniref:LamG-like jellyroll fold domain-containing protein n=1 Tax=Clavibacter zhangzhiyongii TaxID=2768071 RepID=UPI0039DF394B
MSDAGMKLFVDGKVVGQRADVTAGQDFTGFWRIGGDNLGGWPNQPASYYLAGDIAQVSIYPTALTRADVVDHLVASGPHLAHPAGALGRLRQGGLRRRPVVLLAPRRRAGRDDREGRRPERRPRQRGTQRVLRPGGRPRGHRRHVGVVRRQHHGELAAGRRTRSGTPSRRGSRRPRTAAGS